MKSLQISGMYITLPLRHCQDRMIQIVQCKIGIRGNFPSEFRFIHIFIIKIRHLLQSAEAIVIMKIGIQRFVIGVDPQQKILTGISDHFPWDLTVIKLFTVEIIQGTDAWYIFMKQVAEQSHKTSVPQKYIIIKCSVHKIADVTASFRRFVCIAEQNLYRIPVTLIPLRFCPDLRVRKAVSDLFKYRQRFMIILLFVKIHTSFCRIQKCIVSFHN